MAIIEAKNIGEMKAAVREHQPKLVVLFGRHEPLEPTTQLVTAKVDGKPFHEHYNPHEVLFLKLPEDHTPYGFRKKHAQLLKTIGEKVAKQEISLSSNSKVNQAFANASKTVFSGNGNDLMKVFRENLEQTMPEEIAIRTALDVRNHILLNHTEVPITDDMIADVLSEEQKNLDILNLHYDTGFMSGISKFHSGKNYDIMDLKSKIGSYSIMTAEFGKGGIMDEDVALNPEEKKMLEISANWEEGPERKYPECLKKRDDGDYDITSQVGGKGFYLKRSKDAKPGTFEEHAKDLNDLINTLLKK